MIDEQVMAGLSPTAAAAGFELLQPHDGGRGRVWLARETALMRDVALKFQKDVGGRDALLAEADILARCDHPSVVPFYRAVPGEPPARAFYAMKAIPASLREKMAGGQPLPEASVRRLGCEIAGALARLHGLSPPVAHRAVTPENILLDIDGRAVLAGFGSARPVADGEIRVSWRRVPGSAPEVEVSVPAGWKWHN